MSSSHRRIVLVILGWLAFGVLSAGNAVESATLEARRGEAAAFLRPGVELLARGRPVDAIRWLREVVRLDPASIEGRAHLALAHVRARQDVLADAALAVAGLIARHDPEARKRLAGLRGEFPPPWRQAVERATVEPKTGPMSPRALELADLLRRGKTPASRREAARVLAGVSGATSVLARALRTEPSGSVRREILRAVAVSRDPTVWPFVAVHLEGDPDPSARAAAAAALGRLEPPLAAVATGLIRVLKADRAAGPAQAAAQALGLLGGRAAREGRPELKRFPRLPDLELALLAGLRHRDSGVRRACVAALRRITPHSQSTAEQDSLLSRLLSDRDLAVVEATLQTLVREEDLFRHRQEFWGRLERGAPRLQAAAARAIARLARQRRARKEPIAIPPKAANRLRTLAAASDIQVRIEATAALAWLGIDEASCAARLDGWRDESRMLGLDTAGRLTTAGDLALERLRELNGKRQGKE